MILIVDDRPENILPIKKILELHHFLIDTAESGEEALKKILRNNYSVIILDVQMPGMDGFEVATAISGFSKAKDTSIIFLSAVNTEKKFITKGYTSGGIDYLTKPVDPDILVLKVKTFHKLYEQQQELRSIQSALEKEIEIRKKAQEALSQQMQELESVLESLPLIAYTMTPEGSIDYVNENWFQYSVDPRQFPASHPSDNFCEEFKQHLANGLEFTREVRLQELTTLDYKYHLLRVIPIRQGGQLIRWVGTYTDIHLQKLNEGVLEQQVTLRTKELVIKNAELEQSNHELQQFSWVVSHDLKEPLRKIQLFNDMVKEVYLKENHEAVSYLDRSIKASARMTNLINDLLAYSQLTVPASFQPTDLNVLLEDLLTDFDEVISRTKAKVFIGKIPIIDTIPGRIRQVFQNLISNALKFSQPETPPAISITAERIDSKAIDGRPLPDGSYCRIKVQDNGIGFDEKFLDRIFIIFQRLNTKTHYEGTGIGLAIAKKNIDRHHGLISARSQPNEGACFIIVLPINQPQEPET